MADNKELATSLKLAKTKPMFFALVANGTDGELLVEKKKVSPKDIAAAKKAAGGGKVYRGRVTGEDGALVFEMGKDAPGTLSTLTKKIIKREAGLMLNVEYRVAADLAEEESETESTEQADEGATPPPVPPAPPMGSVPPPPPPPQKGAEVMKRLNALTGDIKTALAGPEKARVQSLFVAVNGQIKNSDLDQANTSLDELERLVISSRTPPPAPPQPQPAGGAEVIQRLNAMTADIKTALAGPNKARVQALFVSVNGLIKNKDFAAAGTALDEIAQLVARPTVAPAAPPPPSTANNEAALASEWERRVTALEPRVLEAQKKRPGEAKWMTMFMTVQDLGSEGQFAKALAVLDRLESLLSAPPPSQSESMKAALASWTTARDQVVDSLKQLEGYIRAMNDPDGEGAIVLVKAIQANLAPQPDNLKAVAELEQYIRGDQIITDAEQPNGFGLKISIRGPLLPALQGIRAVLA